MHLSIKLEVILLTPNNYLYFILIEKVSKEVLVLKKSWKDKKVLKHISFLSQVMEHICLKLHL